MIGLRTCLVISCLTQAASAAISLDLLWDGQTPAPIPTSNAAGNLVNQLSVTFDQRIGANQLLVVLSSGEMILGNTGFEPGPGLEASDLTTFVTLGGRTFFDGGNTLRLGSASAINGGCVSCDPGGAWTYGAGVLDITWAASPPVPAAGGPAFLVAQLVLTPDATGTWSYLGTSGDRNDVLVHTQPVAGNSPLGWGIVLGGRLRLLDEATGLPGDFNGDHIVDGPDLSGAGGWEARFGDDVAGTAFLDWQRYFGANLAAQSTASVLSTIPEPDGWWLMLATFDCALCGRLRRTR
jgi:hypothetical protein